MPTPFSPLNLAVLGGGSFGTALSLISGQKGHQVQFWMRSEAMVKHIQTHGHSSRYLTQHTMAPSVTPTSSLQSALAQAELAILAIPCRAVDSVVAQVIEALKQTPSNLRYLMGVMKGLRSDEPILFSRFIQNALDQAGLDITYGVLSGPNLAAEIARSSYTGSMVASKDLGLFQMANQALSTDTFRLYPSQDIIGLEIGGALKNIYAIAAGLLHALNAGENCHGLFMADSLQEVMRFARKLGAKDETLTGISGLGDLVATSSSMLSRNHRLGVAIGQGLSVEDAEKVVGGVAEGYGALQQIRAYALEHRLHMPLLIALGEVVENKRSVDDFIHLWLEKRIEPIA